MKTTEKNNILIAEFMGIRYEDIELEYHTNWDWLMPVVEKIDQILPDDNLVSITYNRCLIEYFAEGVTFEGLGNSRIEATYKAVVEFIQWYNEIYKIK